MYTAEISSCLTQSTSVFPCLALPYPALPFTTLPRSPLFCCAIVFPTMPPFTLLHLLFVLLSSSVLIFLSLLSLLYCFSQLRPTQLFSYLLSLIYPLACPALPCLAVCRPALPRPAPGSRMLGGVSSSSPTHSVFAPPPSSVHPHSSLCLANQIPSSIFARSPTHTYTHAPPARHTFSTVLLHAQSETTD